MPGYLKKLKLWFVVMLSCVVFSLRSQQSDLLHTVGGREMALANATVSLDGNTWACFSNPAGLTNIQSLGIGIACENRYSLKELSSPGISLFSPTARGALGISISYFGTQRYNSQKYTLCYAHNLSPLLEAGIALDYFINVLPDEYERGRAIAGEAGIIFHPVERLNIGVHANNFTASGFNISGTGELPAYLSAGVSWVEKTFLLCTQVTTGKEEKTEISAGTEVALVDNFFLRAGISNSDRYSFSTGLGIVTSIISSDLSCSFHPVLGMSATISIQFFLRKKTN